MKNTEEQPKFEIGINEFELDKEWVNQPRLFLKWAERLAGARKRVEEAKNELNVVRADLDFEIRSNPEKYDLPKVTETSIGATILKQQEYAIAEKALTQAKYEEGMLEAAVEALRQRKNALENLVELHVAGYFSNPRAPEGTKEEVDEMEKRELRRRGQRPSE